MNWFKRFVRLCASSPKTTISGLVLILSAAGMTGAALRTDPWSLLASVTLTPIVTAVVGGLGLLFAGDQDGSAPPKS